MISHRDILNFIDSLQFQNRTKMIVCVHFVVNGQSVTQDGQLAEAP